MTTGYEDFQETPGEADLKQLAELAKAQFAAEQEVKRTDEALKKAKRKLLEIAERQIPELMARIDVESFTTGAGLKIKIRRVIRASIPVAQRPKAYAWLDAHGHSGMIKRTVMVGFNRDQEERANALLEKLRPVFENVSQGQKVESSTLRAFIREQIDAGANIPLDLFGAQEVRIAKIETVNTLS